MRAGLLTVLLVASAVAPVTVLNWVLMTNAMRMAEIARVGTETRDLGTLGSIVASTVDSDHWTVLWAESQRQSSILPLLTTRILMCGTVGVIVLALAFRIAAGRTVFRAARLFCGRSFLLIPTRERDRDIAAWRTIWAFLPGVCLASTITGLCMIWRTGMAAACDVRLAAAWSLVVAACSLAVTILIAAVRAARCGPSDMSTERCSWHCARCGYDVGESVTRGCPECGAGTSDARRPTALSSRARPLSIPDSLRSTWALTSILAVACMIGALWLHTHVAAARVSMVGPLQIATRWRGVTYVRWSDGTQAAFTQGFFTTTGPDLSGRQFMQDPYRRVGTCAWSCDSARDWRVETWASPWFEVGTSREFVGPSGHRVVMVSPGSPHAAGDAWLSPRSVVAVEQYDGERIGAPDIPSIVRQVWMANEHRGMTLDQ